MPIPRPAGHSAALALLALPSLGQAPVLEPLRRALPFEAANDTAVGAADLELDGDLDLIVAGAEGARVLENDGQGHFVLVPGAVSLPAGAAVLLVADFDGQGSPDVYAAGLHRMLLNDGTGALVDHPIPPPPAPPNFVTDAAAGDLDADGDVDVLVTDLGLSLTAYLNNGAGTLTAAPAGFLPPDIAPLEVTLADFDGDGWPEIFVTGTSRYVNTGAGFVEVPGWFDPSLGTSLGRTIELGDLDGDGSLDAVAQASGQVTLYGNDGTGVLTSVLATYSLPTGIVQMRIEDVDGDGDRDVVLLATGLIDGRYRPVLLVNDGAGGFTELVNAFPTVVGRSGGLVLADLDLDGDPDAYHASSGEDDLFLSDGTGTFTRVGSPTADLPSFHDVHFADLNGDDLPDAIGATLHEGVGVLVGDGSGGFTVSHPSVAAPMRRLAIGDLDGDGDVDAYGGEEGDHVLLNDGSARFLLGPRVPPAPGTTRGVALARLERLEAEIGPGRPARADSSPGVSTTSGLPQAPAGASASAAPGAPGAPPGRPLARPRSAA